MTDSLNGMRFDIYERVQLSDNVAAIAELDEIELVPHMQAIPLEDQVILRGHLLLSGTYRAQDERSTVRQLEHWIPVEISLPPSRIQRLEDLAIEIDNFDVDLLSTRSLNVTGVLGLKGLQMSPPQAPVWNEESFTVVHQSAQDDPVEEGQDLYASEPSRPAFQAEPAAPWRREPVRAELPRAEAPGFDAAPSSSPFARQPAAQEPVFRPPQADALPFAADAYAYGASADSLEEQPTFAAQPRFSEPVPVEVEPLAPDAAPSAPDLTAEPEYGGAGYGAPQEMPEMDDYFTGSSPDANADAMEQAPADKPEMKVALGAKASSGTQSSSSGVGLLSQLGDKGAKREMDQRSAEAEQLLLDAEAKEASSSGDELEWTRLFLAKEAGSQSFRKVKMCIVQREDTLDAIATRYNLQTRELQLYNRLNEPQVSEGQVLYIP